MWELKKASMPFIICLLTVHFFDLFHNYCILVLFIQWKVNDGVESETGLKEMRENNQNLLYCQNKSVSQLRTL